MRRKAALHVPMHNGQYEGSRPKKVRKYRVFDLQAYLIDMIIRLATCFLCTHVPLASRRDMYAERATGYSMAEGWYRVR